MKVKKKGFWLVKQYILLFKKYDFVAVQHVLEQKKQKPILFNYKEKNIKNSVIANVLNNKSKYIFTGSLQLFFFKTFSELEQKNSTIEKTNFFYFFFKQIGFFKEDKFFFKEFLTFSATSILFCLSVIWFFFFKRVLNFFFFKYFFIVLFNLFYANNKSIIKKY